MSVVVLGAGIAGLVTALELAWRGVSVRIIEAGASAGGRTSSWNQDGVEFDSGLHVIAEHYVNLLDVLRKVDASSRLSWWDRHWYLARDRQPLCMRFSPLPAPFHLAHPARAIPLSAALKFRVLQAGLDAARRSQAELAELDDVPYLEWHRRHHLGDGFLLELARVAADAAAFLPVEQASARAVLSWLKYMVRDEHAARLATFKGSLAESLVQPLVVAIERAGGRVELGRTAREVCFDEAGVRGVYLGPTMSSMSELLAQGVSSPLDSAGDVEFVPCDTLVSALPVQALRALLSEPQLRTLGLTRIQELKTVPALSLRVLFDRQIRPAPGGAPLVADCVFRDFVDLTALRAEGGQRGLGDRPSEYQFVVSGPDEVSTNAVLEDLVRLWPAARDAGAVRVNSTRIGAALFAAVPGAHALRPATHTAVRGFYLAGDWTRHDLNASMEGAALSGRLAARAVLGVQREHEIPVRLVREAPVTQLLQRTARLQRLARVALRMK